MGESPGPVQEFLEFRCSKKYPYPVYKLCGSAKSKTPMIYGEFLSTFLYGFLCHTEKAKKMTPTLEKIETSFDLAERETLGQIHSSKGVVLLPNFYFPFNNVIEETSLPEFYSRVDQ